MSEQSRRALATAADQCRRVIGQYPGYAPMYTVGGQWNREGETWTHWCEGFFPGILRLLPPHTGESPWADVPPAFSSALVPRQHDRPAPDPGAPACSPTPPALTLTG